MPPAPPGEDRAQEPEPGFQISMCDSPHQEEGGSVCGTEQVDRKKDQVRDMETKNVKTGCMAVDEGWIDALQNDLEISKKHVCF